MHNNSGPGGAEVRRNGSGVAAANRPGKNADPIGSPVHDIPRQRARREGVA